MHWREIERYACRLSDLGGLNVIPILADGSRSPPCSWRRAITHSVCPIDYRKHWARGCAVGVVCGGTSGSLEVLDDDGGLLPRLAVPADLLRKLVVVRTPKKGHHVYYRCSAVGGGKKLAMTAEKVTKWETRGQGNYVLAPCPVIAHPSGKPYEVIQGDLLAVPTITPEERGLLLSGARAFDERVASKALSPAERCGGKADKSYQGRGSRKADQSYQDWWLRMGVETRWQRFNRLVEWEDLLEPLGWEEVRPGHWRRPGKEDGGISATTGKAGDKFYVFSSNAHPFEPNAAYDKCEVFALAWCKGDKTSAYHRMEDYLNK